MRRITSLVFSLCLALITTVAGAQLRTIPADAKVGKLVMGYYPLAQLDGSDVQFTAGARILDQSNAVVVPGGLMNIPLIIRYRLDVTGQIAVAWVLTDDEIAQARSR